MKQCLHFFKLIIWKYVPISRPKNIVIRGRFLISRKTNFSIDSNSKLVVMGDADFTNARINLRDSTISCISIICNDSNIFAHASNLVFNEFVNFRNAAISIKNSNIEGNNHFRVHHYNLNINKSSFKAGSYFMCDGQRGNESKFEMWNAFFLCKDNCRIQAYIIVSNGKLIIGSNSFLNKGTKVNCQIAIEIGSYVMISYDCVLLDNNSHSINYLERRKEIDAGFPNGTNQLQNEEIPKSPIKIEDDVWIGVNTMVFKGVTIGSKSVIAAGTYLTKSVLNNSLVYGNPNQRRGI